MTFFEDGDTLINLELVSKIRKNAVTCQKGIKTYSIEFMSPGNKIIHSMPFKLEEDRNAKLEHLKRKLLPYK